MSEPHAGRDLDALVAEKVMGWRRGTKTIFNLGYHATGMLHGWEVEGWYKPDNVGGWQEYLPYYSTDIAAAWDVVEKMGGMWVMPADNGHHWTAGKLSLEEPSTLGGTWGETAPHAICLAALRAVGVEVDGR